MGRKERWRGRGGERMEKGRIEVVVCWRVGYGYGYCLRCSSGISIEDKTGEGGLWS